MSSPREIVCRDFKKSERLFLNYESQKSIALGDIFVWDGRKAEFRIVSRLALHGLTPLTQQSKVKGTKLYQSTRGVNMAFHAQGNGGYPTMDFKFSGSGCYSLQAFDSTIEYLDEVKLASDITQQCAHGALNWKKNWIVVTTVWSADAYTQLVASSSGANAGVCATVGAVPGPFNIADVTLKVSLGYGNSLCSQEFIKSKSCPFFIGMKYRTYWRFNSLQHMARYGG